MNLGSTNAKCCPVFDKLPTNTTCHQPEIDAEWNSLEQRHRQMFTHHKRLLRMAKPQVPITKRFVRTCPCKFSNTITIIREQSRRTRTDQLALPPVRRLLLFKERVRDFFNPQQLLELNRLIRTSLFSMYSRLNNVQPPLKPVPIPKWDDDEWKKHRAYLKKLAKPKKEPPKPKLPVKRMPLEQMTQFKKLALPKIRLELVKEPWTLTAAAKKYVPSDRMFKLAVSKLRDDSALYQPLPIPIAPGALTAKASKRIQELATAREKGAGESDLKENPYSIAPNALKARATARIKELAEPKEYEDTHFREIPWPISPAALKANASPRTIELAKPKGS